MQEEDFETAIKVIVVGNGGVGKTSMIRRFCHGDFTDQYKKTIGVDFLEKEQFIQELGEQVRIMLWDTAGQEEFDAITKTYYRGAGAAVLVFSTIDRDSFEAIRDWKGKVEAECGEIIMVLVQNKVDLLDQAVVTSDEAEELAGALGLKFYRTSVQDNLNIDDVFKHLAVTYVQNGGGASSHGVAAPIASIGSIAQPTTSSQPAAPAPAREPAKSSGTVDLTAQPKRRTKGKKAFLGGKCTVL